MSARDEILDKLLTAQERRRYNPDRDAGKPSPRPEAPSPAIDPADLEGLVSRFIERLQGVGGEACRAGSLEDARKALGELRMRWDAQGVVYSLDPLVQELGVPEWLKGEGVPGQVLDGGEGERVWRAELAAAAAAQREPNVPWHMAVIGCAGAIAETGSIAHLTAPGHGRGGWLLCRAQVVLLTAEQIVSDLDGLFVGGGALDRNALPRAVTLVTGPSRTADIEQTLTIGVHGPGKFAAVVMG